MIIWSGWGFLVAIIFFFSSLITEKLVDQIFSQPYFYQQNGWPKLLAAIISAFLVWLLSKKLKNTEERKLIDPKTKKTVILKNKQALFFIDISKWPYILIAIGILLAIFGNSSF